MKEEDGTSKDMSSEEARASNERAPRRL
jgi:hypothetical protein